MRESFFYLLSVKMMHLIQKGLYGDAYEILKEIEDELMAQLSKEEYTKNATCNIGRNEQ